MKSDYLKYWRVVRQFIKVKHKLSQSDLDILLFLKSEEYFSKDKFQEFDNLISWEKHRFERLRQEGWIEIFRKGWERERLYISSLKKQKGLPHQYTNISMGKKFLQVMMATLCFLETCHTPTRCIEIL